MAPILTLLTLWRCWLNRPFQVWDLVRGKVWAHVWQNSKFGARSQILQRNLKIRWDSRGGTLAEKAFLCLLNERTSQVTYTHVHKDREFTGFHPGSADSDKVEKVIVLELRAGFSSQKACSVWETHTGSQLQGFWRGNQQNGIQTRFLKKSLLTVIQMRVQITDQMTAPRQLIVLCEWKSRWSHAQWVVGKSMKLGIDFGQTGHIWAYVNHFRGQWQAQQGNSCSAKVCHDKASKEGEEIRSCSDSWDPRR